MSGLIGAQGMLPVIGENWRTIYVVAMNHTSNVSVRCVVLGLSFIST